MTKQIYVQYGCGWDAPEGWLNFDSSPTLRIEHIPVVGRYLSIRLKGNTSLFPSSVKYGDIVKGLPLAKESVRGIYCSHVLEHLPLKDCRRALINTKYLLVPGGIFRLVVPDLYVLAKNYYENASNQGAAIDFMRDAALGEEYRNRGLKGLAHEFIGNSRHRWMWDYVSLERELKAAGFKQVRRANIGDCSDCRFREVERYERWVNCLGVECVN